MKTSVALPPGTEVGGLEIRRTLGRGGFGIVYEAYDPGLDISLAVKEFYLRSHARREGLQVVPVDTDAVEVIEQFLARFLREARLLAQLHQRATVHSGSLVVVHRVFQANQTAYMVMKMYQGQTLRERVTSTPGVVTQDWLTGLLRSVLDALDALHSMPGESLVHRDVSPDNIIVQLDDTPVLLDFGAVRNTNAELSAMIYKPEYSPIEQYTEAYPQGPWTDLYALCGTAYFALCGEAPGDAVNRLAGSPFISAAQRGHGRFGDEFLAVLDKGLSILPQDRYQSVEQMRAALDRVASGGWSAPPYRPGPFRDAGHSDVTVVRTVSKADAGALAAAETLDDPDATRVVGPLHSSSSSPRGPWFDNVAGNGGSPCGVTHCDIEGPAPKATQPRPRASDVGQFTQRRAGLVGGAVFAVAALVATAYGLRQGSEPIVEPRLHAAKAKDLNTATVSRAEVAGAGVVAGLSCDHTSASWYCVLDGLSRTVSAKPSQSFDVVPRTVSVGEQLDLSIRSPIDGFLYVFAADEPVDSRLTLLFPRNDDSDNRIVASVPMALPRRPAWDIVANPPLGKSWLLAVVTSEPVSAWSPMRFNPVHLPVLIAAFNAKSPWRAFGLTACEPDRDCVQPLVVMHGELLIR